MSDLIRREDLVKELDAQFAVGDITREIANDILNHIPTAEPERTAKATRKPEAFFYRCECGYGLCCEKNDMNYCPSCGGRLEWE